MVLQLRALRDALLDAGSSPKKANRAAEELAGYETRLTSIDGRLALITWMVGSNLAATLGVLWWSLSR